MIATRWNNSTRIVLPMKDTPAFRHELLQVWPSEGTPPYYSLVLRYHDGRMAYCLPVNRATAAQLVAAGAARRCGECGGKGTLTTLGGDWGATPDHEVPCWRCRPEVAHVGR